MRACTASATFSSTEKPGRTEVIWNERASPSAARSACIGRRGDVVAVKHDHGRNPARNEAGDLD